MQKTQVAIIHQAIKSHDKIQRKLKKLRTPKYKVTFTSNSVVLNLVWKVISKYVEVETKLTKTKKAEIQSLINLDMEMQLSIGLYSGGDNSIDRLNRIQNLITQAEEFL